MTATSLHGTERLEGIDDFSKDELIKLIESKGVDDGLVNRLIDEDMGFEFVNSESHYPSSMNVNMKAEALLENIYPSSFGPEYNVLADMHKLHPQTIFGLVKKGKVRDYFEQLSRFPEYVTNENKARALMLGFDSEYVAGLDYIENGMIMSEKVFKRSKERSRDDANSNLISALELRWFDNNKYRFRTEQNVNMAIFKDDDDDGQKMQLKIMYAANFPGSKNKQVNEDYRIKFCIEHNLDWTSFKETSVKFN